MWRLITISTLSLALGACCQSAFPEVNLGYGRYQGIINAGSGNLEFLGIRYANPPTGDFRWRAPQPPRIELRPHLADNQPEKCYQTFPGSAPTNPFSVGGASQPVQGNKTLEARQSGVGESEDCLFLNVYTPSAQLQPDMKLPVVVWIHGGAYLLGSASGSGFGPGGPYEGTELIKRAGGNAIVVVIQYRLGVFGFLSGAEVKGDGALNAGLLDQEFAFRWVQQYISKFGGDPSQVTIWGQSAGAGSVLQHLIANGGNTNPPLFKSAISSSLFIPSQYPYDHRIPEGIYSQVVSLTGCSNSTSTLECLRKADVGKIQAANLQISSESFAGTFPWVPVVDGTFIEERPMKALQGGKINSRSVLAMTNAGESVGIFVPSDLPSTIDVASYVGQLFPTVDPQVAAAAAAQYTGLGSNPQQIAALYTEVIFLCPTYALLRQLNGKGYKGSLDVPPAMHGDDLSYLFPGITTAPVSFDNAQFAQAFSQSFMDFVLAGDPNVKRDPTSILPAWAAWSPSAPAEVSFNRTGDSPNIAAIFTNPGVLERCQFWADNSELIAQ
ncbi:Alpha/Beta hydrolase protein [Coprinopsis sp. MPI-PUGE-AT-0042]|nr:Alpha/Beta hydrolase protein [Coprinopsis sp. MPI-PUGE-AT-0042]